MVKVGFVASMVMLVFSVAHAQEPPQASSALSSQLSTCAACHGADGKGGVADYPRLAGLGEAYLHRQLDAFASGERENAVMAPLAKALTQAQRAELAGYFSQVEPGDMPLLSAVTDINDAGRTLAEQGRWEQGIPACVQCHGPGGVGIGDDFPSLAGQPARYLQDQLKAWRTGARTGDPMGLMAGIAKTLTGDDLAAVAEYFSVQSPTEAGHE